MGKTDRLDALVLAQFAQSAHSNQRAAPAALARAAEAELKALVTRRRQLLAMLTAESNRRERAPKVIRRSMWRASGRSAFDRGDRATGRDVLSDSPVQQAKAVLLAAVQGWDRS